MGKVLFLPAAGADNSDANPNNIVFTIKDTEAAARGVLWKKVFLEISQNSQENICARVCRPVTFFKKRLWHKCFLWILRNF